MSASVPLVGPSGHRVWPLPLRLAIRDLRGGLRGFVVFLACIALGVAAIAGVRSFASSLVDGLAREGRVILGGDVSFSLVHREATAVERAFLDGQGEVSAAATMRAMARASADAMTLVELKAVDDAYPLYGTVALDPPGRLPEVLAVRERVFGAAADAALLARLNLEVGSRISVGDAEIEIRAVLKNEPDKLAGGIGFGPRLLVSDAALRATGLLQPGSLVRWHYRVRLPGTGAGDGTAQALVDAAAARLPDAGWEVRTRTNASPQLERNIERFTQFLALVGLTALLVGGVGVANAVKSHLDRKREVIATMKALGATGGSIFAVYLVQVMMLALIGTGLGLLLGAALPFAVAGMFGAILPLPLAPALHADALVWAVLYGLLTALAFALWPLGRAHDVPVSALFRDEVAPERRWPRWRYVGAAALVAAVLAALAIILAYDRKIALIFIGGTIAVFILLRLLAAAIMELARHVPRPRMPTLRLALANIHRPAALTPTVVLSLGLGLAVLVTVTLIDGNLRRQFLATLPDRAPSFFFVDLQDADTGRFDAFLREQAPNAKLERVPMLRGRIVAVDGTPAAELQPPDNVAWALRGDRGITYAEAVPAGSRVVEGEWWNASYNGPPLVSLEKRIADGLGLKLGDTLTVNVLGRNIAAKVANLRVVDWQTLGINFVLVYSPGAFRGAPHTHIATLTYPDGGGEPQEIALLKAVAGAFPAVTIVRVREALDAVGQIVANLAAAIRGASLVTLVAAALVLAGALAAGHRHRVYDAVILKTLGATRRWLVAAYAIEYLLLGVATALFGVVAGSIAAWLVVTEVMNLRFTWLPLPAALAAFGALAFTVALGLVGTFSALARKPAAVLRHR